MRGSALRQNILLLSLLLAVPACSKISVSKVSGSTQRLEGDSKPSTPSAGNDDAIPGKDEAVVPPNNISGTFLVCVVTANANPLIFGATAQCALQDDKQVKINLTTAYSSFLWKPIVPDLNSVRSIMRELPQEAPWHLEIEIRADSPVQLKQALSGMQVSLEVRHLDGTKESITKSVVTQGDDPSWLSLDGNRLPGPSIPGGTARMGKDILALCRVYSNGGVFPGKLQKHETAPNEYICYSTRDGATIRSLAEDGRTQLNASDVLVPGKRASNELLEWVDVLPGRPLPARAYVGGVDDLGEELVVCRGKESSLPTKNDPPNDPLGEWTPGYIKASTLRCQHEYYGQKTSLMFQVLVRKP